MEVILLPEMLEAGVEALEESERRQLDAENICVAIFLAMRAIEMMAQERESKVVH